MSSTAAIGSARNRAQKNVMTGMGIHMVMPLSMLMKNGSIRIRKVIDMSVRTRMMTVERVTGTPARRMNMICAIAPPVAPGVTRARK